MLTVILWLRINSRIHKKVFSTFPPKITSHASFVFIRNIQVVHFFNTFKCHVFVTYVKNISLINNLFQNRFADALSLGIDFFEEKGKAVLGLRGPRKQRQRLVKDKVS